MQNTQPVDSSNWLSTELFLFINSNHSANSEAVYQWLKSTLIYHLLFPKPFFNLTYHRQTYPCLQIRTNMKTQHETTIQFSGYPLSIVEIQPTINKVKLTVIKSARDLQISPSSNSIANDPKNWDIDWFNSYE
jgi:hypothetical protein